MLTMLNWLTPDELEWAGLALFITGCFIAAQLFCTFWRRWRAAGKELGRQLNQEPCAQCQPGGRPPCVCTSDCGASGCVGDHTGLALLTPEDMKILRGIEQTGLARWRPWQRGRKPVKR